MNIVGLDLATKTGWACRKDGITTSGLIEFKSGRFEGGGMRFLKFQSWLEEFIPLVKPDVVFFEEIRRHMSTDAAHVHGGLLAVLTSTLEKFDPKIPYQGLPVGTIKKHATGKGNAGKPLMVSSAKQKWPDQNIIDDNVADALWIMSLGLQTLNKH